MKDLAWIADVSASTVSRVLTGNIPVRDATMNYRPNLIPRGLRSKNRNLISFVVHEVIHATFTSLVRRHMDISLSRIRLEGFMQTLESDGVTVDPAMVTEGDFGFAMGARAVRALIKTGRPLSALWAQSDLMAIGAMQELYRYGIAVPGDVSIIGMDDIHLSEMILPRLTTILQPFEQMCRNAVDLILERRLKGETTATRIANDPSLFVRDSTRYYVKNKNIS